MKLRNYLVIVCALFGSVVMAAPQADQLGAMFNDSNAPKQSYTVLGAKPAAHLQAAKPSLNQENNLAQTKSPLQNNNMQVAVSNTVPLATMRNPMHDAQEKKIQQNLSQITQQQLMFQGKMQMQLQSLQQENEMLTSTIQDLYKKVNTLQAANAKILALKANAANTSIKAEHISSNIKITWYLEIFFGLLVLLCLVVLLFSMIKRGSNTNTNGNSADGIK